MKLNDSPINKKHPGLLLGILAVALLVSACGPIHSTVAMKEARDALDMARQAGAPEVAPYEWTMAYEYYKKSQEEWGYSDFRMSGEVARRTVELAESAMDAVGGFRPVDGGTVPIMPQQAPGTAPQPQSPPGTGAPPPPQAQARPSGVPQGVTVYTDPASGRRYYLEPQSGNVVYINEASP